MFHQLYRAEIEVIEKTSRFAIFATSKYDRASQLTVTAHKDSRLTKSTAPITCHRDIMRKVRYISICIGILFTLFMLIVILRNKENLVSPPEYQQVPDQAKISRNKENSVSPPEHQLVPDQARISRNKENFVSPPEHHVPDQARISRSKENLVTPPEHHHVPDRARISRNKENFVSPPEHHVPDQARISRSKENLVTPPEHHHVPDRARISRNKENLVSLPEHHHVLNQARMSGNDHWADVQPPTENMLVRNKNNICLNELIVVGDTKHFCFDTIPRFQLY